MSFTETRAEETDEVGSVGRLCRFLSVFDQVVQGTRSSARVAVQVHDLQADVRPHI